MFDLYYVAARAVEDLNRPAAIIGRLNDRC